MKSLRQYRKVWLVDFEFATPAGEHPIPHCVVARDLHSDRLMRWWLADGAPAHPPYGVGSDSLFVAYYASAELGCHLALNWPMPACILDLSAEFRLLVSGLSVTCGRGLLGALAYHGLDAIDAAEKQEMQELGMRGGPFTSDERAALVDYCQEDVDALARLLPAMLPKIDLPRALLRGQYMIPATQMEWTGVPIDTDTLTRLCKNWARLKSRLIEVVDANYGVFMPIRRNDATSPLRFSTDRWAAYLNRKGILWPHLPSGKLDLKDSTFKEMARAHPAEVSPIRELRKTLSKLRLNSLAVGSAGRNRTILGAFGTKTGRNAPKAGESIWSQPKWLRSLIRPAPGRAIAYLDWAAQEYGIAAALSGDRAMKRDYQEDPYLAFAKRVGALPADATKRTHGRERELYKACCGLGAMYGASEYNLAPRLGISVAEAQELLRLHRETYPTFWRWSDAVQDFAFLHGYLETEFGWRVHVEQNANPRSFRNFLMQANGAEMMRLASIWAMERGITVCAPVHDAFLIEADADAIDAEVARMQKIMRQASLAVLPGFPLRTDVRIIHYPDRFLVEQGKPMWRTVRRLLREPKRRKLTVSL
jgi:hypothetical protein